MLEAVGGCSGLWWRRWKLWLVVGSCDEVLEAVFLRLGQIILGFGKVR